MQPYAPYPAMTTDNGVVGLSLEFIVGATGAVPTTGGANGNGITGGREFGTPVRNGVGDYTFPLTNPCVRLVDWNCIAVGAHSTTTGKYAELIADASTTVGGASVRVQFTRGDTGAAAEVAQNDVIKLTLYVVTKTP